MSAPKGNKNALKHGLYAHKAVVVGEVVAGSPARSPGQATASWHRSGQRRLVLAPDYDGSRRHVSPGLAVAAGSGSAALRDGPATAIRYLEEVMDEIFARLKRAEGEEFTRLANALSLAATALFNGHRTIAFLTGGMSPVDEALRELQALDFSED